MNANSTRKVQVEGGETQVVGHVGLHALGSFADRLGVPETLTAAIGWHGNGAPIHPRGRVVTHAMLMLAGGGDSCADIDTLATQPRLFADVASDSTLYRTFTKSLTPEVLDRARHAMATVRSKVWQRAASTAGPVVLDIDASLVEIHSENKEGTGPTYKKGFGFHPVFCFSDATGEALAAKLRPGNATANDTTDLLGVLDDGVRQLPVEVRAGHTAGDDPASVSRQVVVRSDSAGASKLFMAGCWKRNIGFQVVARKFKAISAGIEAATTDPARWTPALNQDGTIPEHQPRDRIARVCEITDLITLPKGYPPGTRVIIRREPLHPGAQTTLFPDHDYRFWGHYTDQPGDPAELDRAMRAHAHVEDHIARLKDSGLLRFPFTDLAANQAWLQVVCWAADLVRWFQLLCLTGALAKATPRRLRWQLWHTPARIITTGRRTIIRILDHWPTTTDLIATHHHIAALT